jgi:tRNA(adenine34) deaminase
MSLLQPFNEEYFMKQALAEAQKAYDSNEVPVGAVIVLNNQIISRAHNQTELLTDVTAHAEILAISSATSHMGIKYLSEATIYVTLEPCMMCSGALYWSKIGKVVFGAADEKRGFMKYGKELLHPKTTLAYGIMEAECKEILQKFFQKKRASKRIKG